MILSIRVNFNDFKYVLQELAYLLIFCCLLLLIPIYFGTSFNTILLYFLYVISFNIVPGILVYIVLNGNRQLAQGWLLSGWVLGLCLEVLSYHVMDRLGSLSYFNFKYYPFLILFIVCPIFLFEKITLNFSSDKPNFLSFPLLFICFLSLFLFCLAILTSIDMPPNTSENLVFFTEPIHFAEQARVANSILAGWPYQDFMVDGIPLFYNYLIHTHIASASYITGLPIFELCSGIVQFILTIVCLLSIYFFGINHYQNKWIGLLVIIQVFGVIGWQPINSWIFGGGIPKTAALVISSLAAFPIFFTIVSEVNIFVNKKSNWLGRLIIISILIFAESGMRTPALVALVSGLGLDILWNYIQYHRISWRKCLILSLTIVAIFMSLIAFYGLFSGFSATKFLYFVTNPADSLQSLNSTKFLQNIGFYSYLSGMMSFVIVALGQATFLIGGLFYLLKKKYIGKHPLDIFWLGTFLCGCFFLYFTYAGGGSHFTFMHYGNLGLNFLGARGLLLCIDNQKKLGTIFLLPPTIFIITLMLALLQFVETGYILSNYSISNYKINNQEFVVDQKDYKEMINYMKQKSNPNYLHIIESNNIFLEQYAGVEIPWFRLYGTLERVSSYLNRDDQNSKLKKKVLFLESLSKIVQSGNYDQQRLQSLKNQYGIKVPLKLIINHSPVSKLTQPSGWEFRNQLFMIFDLK